MRGGIEQDEAEGGWQHGSDDDTKVQVADVVAELIFAELL